MQPIITSFLDIDFYKFTMGNVIFQNHPDVPVTFAFTNRTKNIPLAHIINERDLRWQLDAVRGLRANNSDLHYLRGTNEYGERMFPETYLQHLKGIELPPYSLARTGDTYDLRFAGPWSTVTYWETMALSIINELYYRALLSRMTRFERELVRAEGQNRLAEKIRILREIGEGITFSDFGTRRRFSREWQQYVTGVLAEELPSGMLLGSSNTEIAMNLGLVPMGTFAHEMDMSMSGIMHESDDAIRASHQQVLRMWWQAYGEGLSVALSDTYGSEFFFRNFTPEQARQWKGTRQDSGDPYAYGERAIRYYEENDIDPKTKLVVFSDGLDLDTMLALRDHFHGRIKHTFGWGTNLTNDLGLSPLSLVAKVVEANGHGTVKLSDNLAKAVGHADDVARFKRIFGYSGDTFEECRY